MRKCCPFSTAYPSVLGPHRPRHSGLPVALPGNSNGTPDGIAPCLDKSSHNHYLLSFNFTSNAYFTNLYFDISLFSLFYVASLQRGRRNVCT